MSRIDLETLKTFTVSILNKTFKNKRMLDKIDETEEGNNLVYGATEIASKEYVDASIDLTRTGEYLGNTSNIEDTPIGTIISFMGTKVPKHYLLCDGSCYEISSYPHLVDFLAVNYGRVNYFGGDGVTTFAVPDLRGEFLRGKSDNTSVGEHQDATQHLSIYNSGAGNALISPQGTQIYNNEDGLISIPNNKTFSIYGRSSTWNDSQDIPQWYTSRPTNTTVQYCIKYEPTYYMTFTGNSLQVSIMEDDSVIVPCSTSTTARNITVALNNEITNFDYIEVVTTVIQNDGQDVSTIRHRVKVSDLTYHAANDTTNVKGRIYLNHESQSTSTKCGFSCWFIDEKHFFIYVAMTNSSTGWNKIRLDDIVGIKEDYKKNGIRADRTTLFDAGSIPFTNTKEPITLSEDITQFQGIRFTYTMNAVLNPQKYKSTSYVRTDSLRFNEISDVFIGGFATRYFAGHFNDGDNTFTIDEVREDLNDKIGLLKIEGLRYDEYDKDDALYINDDYQSGDTKSLWSSKNTYNKIKDLIKDDRISLEDTWSSKKIDEEIEKQTGATCSCHW